jgi:hypothetical protein
VVGGILVVTRIRRSTCRAQNTLLGGTELGHSLLHGEPPSAQHSHTLTFFALLTRLHLGRQEYEPSKVTSKEIPAIRKDSGTMDTFTLSLLFVSCRVMIHYTLTANTTNISNINELFKVRGVFRLRNVTIVGFYYLFNMLHVSVIRSLLY